MGKQVFLVMAESQPQDSMMISSPFVENILSREEFSGMPVLRISLLETNMDFRPDQVLQAFLGSQLGRVLLSTLRLPENDLDKFCDYLVSIVTAGDFDRSTVKHLLIEYLYSERLDTQVRNLAWNYTKQIREGAPILQRCEPKDSKSLLANVEVVTSGVAIESKVNLVLAFAFRSVALRASFENANVTPQSAIDSVFESYAEIDPVELFFQSPTSGEKKSNTSFFDYLISGSRYELAAKDSEGVEILREIGEIESSNKPDIVIVWRPLMDVHLIEPFQRRFLERQDVFISAGLSRPAREFILQAQELMRSTDSLDSQILEKYETVFQLFGLLNGMLKGLSPAQRLSFAIGLNDPTLMIFRREVLADPRNMNDRFNKWLSDAAKSIF